MYTHSDRSAPVWQVFGLRLTGVFPLSNTNPVRFRLTAATVIQNALIQMKLNLCQGIFDTDSNFTSRTTDREAPADVYSAQGDAPPTLRNRLPGPTLG